MQGLGFLGGCLGSFVLVFMLVVVGLLFWLLVGFGRGFLW
jgi:hypothetical protein